MIKHVFIVVWNISSLAPFCWRLLTHWGRVTHICVENLIIIGSDNGLLPGRRQAIIWTNTGLLLIGPLRTNFSEILIKILTFFFEKMCLKLSSAKWYPFCLGLNVLGDCAIMKLVHHAAWLHSDRPTWEMIWKKKYSLHLIFTCWTDICQGNLREFLGEKNWLGMWQPRDVYRLLSNISRTSNTRRTPTSGNCQLEFSLTISLIKTSNTIYTSGPFY